MAKMTIVGSAAYNRKDNRAEVHANVSFGGKTYQTIDLGLGGFRIDGYEGELKPGQEFVLEGISNRRWRYEVRRFIGSSVGRRVRSERETVLSNSLD